MGKNTVDAGSGGSGAVLQGGYIVQDENAAVREEKGGSVNHVSN